MQDASWVGLGWNLDAGGVITRIIEGNIDGWQSAGYNYGQYNIVDSLQPANNTFLGLAYNNYAASSYDLALDVFDCQSSIVSGKFFWLNNKAYQLDYNKNLYVKWPSYDSAITVTTTDGTICIFGAKEVTVSHQTWQTHSINKTYPSAWFLTSIISADKKDTIRLNYANYSWEQAQIKTQYSYVVSTSIGTSDMGSSNDYGTGPVIQTKILQSITCRNVTVNFVPDAALRTDVLGSSPKLKEINVVDNITGATIVKDQLTYEYFTGPDNTAAATWLKLKRFQSLNPKLSSDIQTYTFKYEGDLEFFPYKGTTGTDCWGFYNGHDNNTSGLPAPALGFYNPVPPVNWTAPTGSKEPVFSKARLGALDTLFYPTGGFTVYKYELNQYSDASHTSADGPGIRVSKILDFANRIDTPSRQRTYTYLNDDGTSSSGKLRNFPNFTGPSFSANSNNYTAYMISNTSAGVGGINPGFYYTKVAESESAGGELHWTAYYFSNVSSTLFTSIHLTTKRDYVYNATEGKFKPLRVTTNDYDGAIDTTFLFGTSYLKNYTFTGGMTLPVYAYGYTSSNVQAEWFPLRKTAIVDYDADGNSMLTITNYNYNSVRNISSIEQMLSDSSFVVKVFKYPEDYTGSLTANMVASNVLSPVLEQQTWLQSAGSSTPTSMIAGEVTTYDQSIFKPLSVYQLETASPIYSLNNQTTTGSLYNTLLSDTRYTLSRQFYYDANNNIKQLNRASDMNMSFLWDYRYMLPIAEIKNTTVDRWRIPASKRMVPAAGTYHRLRGIPITPLQDGLATAWQMALSAVPD